MSHLLHVFPLLSLHELTLITDAYCWNAHDNFGQTIYFFEGIILKLIFRYYIIPWLQACIK